METLVTALVPSLSRSLAQQFNLFNVLRHGTHEKQISNIFAWLLDADETHELGTVFQEIFLDLIENQIDSADALPRDKYRVQQEVDTSSEAGMKDIADIVLMSKNATIVVENFVTSDGHGHDYYGYRDFGAMGGKQSVVVLLCSRHEPNLQIDGWQNAVVVTYVQALRPLREYILQNATWRNSYAPQNFLLKQLFEHFVEGPNAVNTQDQIAFIKAMCETGESERYTKRPIDLHAEEFSDLIAQHARRQFEQGRVFLGEVKRALRLYADTVVKEQINEAVFQRLIETANARLAGQYEWYAVLRSSDNESLGGFVFGPTAAFYNDINNEPIERPNYSKVFALARTGKQSDYILIETDVGLDEVAAGLPVDDTRLSDAFLDALRQRS